MVSNDALVAAEARSSRGGPVASAWVGVRGLVVGAALMGFPGGGPGAFGAVGRGAIGGAEVGGPDRVHYL